MPAQTFIFRQMSSIDTLFFNSILFNKLVLNDLKRDLPRLEGKKPLSHWKTFYSGSQLLSCLFMSYTQLHIYKALCTMANHPHYYEHIRDAAYWSSYDPTFTMPLAVMVLNYILLSQSRHPFLVNIRKNWSEMAKSMLVIYGSALAIVLP